MTKISQLSSIGDSLAIGDQFLIRDIDDAGSPNKSVTVSGITRALADGDATAPALAFAADKNTGIYRAGTDSLAVATNGAGRLFVDASGNVGIGAASFGYGEKLGVGGTIIASDGTVVGRITSAAGTAFWGTTTNHSLAFQANGAERLRITSAGLVGVGTSAPGTTLEVSAGGGSSPSLTGTGGNFAITQPGLLTSLEFGGYSSAPYGLWLQTKNKTGGSFPLILNPLGGAVGIGTSSPADLLHLGGATNKQLRIDSSSSPSYVGSYNGALNLAANRRTSDGSIVDSARSAAYIGITSDVGPSSVTVSTASAINTQPTLRVTVNGSGDVGIGISTPAARFDAVAAETGTYAASTQQIVARLYNQPAALGSGVNSAFLSLQTTANGAVQNPIARIGVVGESYASNNGSFVIATRNVTGVNERVRVDSAGNVGIGTTSPSHALDVTGSIRATANVYGNTTVQTPWLLNQTNSDLAIWNQAAFAVNFFTSGTERARIDSSGRLLVGTSTARGNFFNSTVSAALQVEGTGNDSSSLSIVRNSADTGRAILTLAKTRGGSVGSTTVVQSGDALGSIEFQGSDGTEFVQAAAIQCEVDGTPGANDMPGRLVFSTTADGASSPTERMRINSAGVTTFGTSIAGGSGKTTLYPTDAGGGLLIVETGGFACSIMDRQLNDGTLISFKQASTEEGSISVSGTTVSYNGAHLSRWSQITGIDPYNKTVRPEILRGTVMSNLDEMCDWTCPESGECQDNEQLNKTKISDVEGDKNVAGIFQSWDDDDDTWVNDFYLAMTGDFVIRIAAGTTVERGDLLMSAGDGTAKPQDDDIIRSKTIAKVTSTNVSCTYDDGSYCVPCVLMAC